MWFDENIRQGKPVNGFSTFPPLLILYFFLKVFLLLLEFDIDLCRCQIKKLDAHHYSLLDIF